jgi:membrane protease subunit HflK
VSAPEDGLNMDQKIRRGVGKTILNWFVVLLALSVIGGWISTGVYYTEPGEAAVVLVLGRYHITEYDEGLHWRWPAPLGDHDTVNVSKMRRVEFGVDKQSGANLDQDVVRVQENEVQTSDSNIVIPRYVVQYRIQNPFTYLYSLENPTQTLRDAAQAAMREAIGRHSIDEVLHSDRRGIQAVAKTILEEILVNYARLEGDETAFEIRSIQLQSSQPPSQVQDAFDDVVAAKQDKDRAVSVAEGDAREIRERAGAEATELTQSAIGYKDAKVLDATGEAARFESLLKEYKLAKGVTRQRLYFEAMEDILVGIDKYVVEPNTVQLLPTLRDSRNAVAASAAPSLPDVSSAPVEVGR